MDDIYLYILMRTDLASMNPGKACAQATHAANQCVRLLPRSDSRLIAWEEDRGFGTCIVLAVNGDTLRSTISAIMGAGHHAGITHDPGYPLRDGDVMHSIPLDTCGFAFGPRAVLEPFLRHLPLMP